MMTARISAAVRRTVAALCAAVLLLAVLPLSVRADYENTYVNTGNQAADLVGVAKTQIGYREGSDNYNKYAAYFGNPNSPWCGYFVSWCARQANIPTAILPNTGWADGFNNSGVFHERTSGYLPQTGDLMLYGDYYDTYHVSIVERYDASTGRVWVIDGNWSDQVSHHFETLQSSEVAGFITPNYTSQVTELSFLNAVTPSVVLVGSPFSVSGLVCSPNTIKSVTVAITDRNGNTRVSASASPNAKSYDIQNLDASIPFGSLSQGEYLFIVTASDTSTTYRWSYPFEVVGSVNMSISSVVAPTSVVQGNIFRISGVITCGEMLSAVSVSVYNADGVYQTGGSTSSINANTYDIKGLDDYVSFGRLSVGSYIMRVAARSANASREWDYPFVVVAKADTFSLSDAVYPSTLTAETPFSVGGTVTSSGTLTSVNVSVTDSDGVRRLYATAIPSGTSYSLSALSSMLAFETLPLGAYTYTIDAATASGSRQWQFPFNVVAPQETFSLEDPRFPSELVEGNSFTIGGTLSCDGVLRSVRITVTAQDGTDCFSASAQPNAVSCALSELAPGLSFSSLGAGSYTCSVYAETSYNTYLQSYPFTVTARTDTFYLSGFSEPTDYLQGTAFSVSGLLSASSMLTSVALTVTDASGETYDAVSMQPRSMRCDLSSLPALSFDELTPGEYTLLLTASTAYSDFSRSYPFCVLPRTDAFYLVGFSLPQALLCGESLTLSGRAASDDFLTSVRVRVLDESGSEKLTDEAQPNSRRFALSNLEGLSFETLPQGRYTLCVELSTAYREYRYVVSFRVIDSEVPGDVNFDGKADQMDVMLLFRCVYGDLTLSDAQLKNVVIHGNALSIQDAKALYNYVSGKTASYG